MFKFNKIALILSIIAIVPCAIQAKKPGSSKKQQPILKNDSCVRPLDFSKNSRAIGRLMIDMPTILFGNPPFIPGNINTPKKA